MSDGLINTEFLGDKVEDVEEELFMIYSLRAGYDSQAKSNKSDKNNKNNKNNHDNTNTGNNNKDILSSIVSDTSHTSALGLVNQRKDKIELEFTFSTPRNSKVNPTAKAKGKPEARQELESPLFSTTKKPLLSRKSKRQISRATGAGTDAGTSTTNAKKDLTISVTLAQDITGLRTRVGDTGGGVWRGSLLLAHALLQQWYSDCSNPSQTEVSETSNNDESTAPIDAIAPIGLNSPNEQIFGLFNLQTLRSTNVLELGAGTGLLGLIIAPQVSKYTCSDLPELVPLIYKNITLNSSLFSQLSKLSTVHIQSDSNLKSGPGIGTASKARPVTLEGYTGRLSVEPLDWNDVHNCPPASRKRLFQSSTMTDTPTSTSTSTCPPAPNRGNGIVIGTGANIGQSGGNENEKKGKGKEKGSRTQLILAVDCVFNPALIPPLLSTIHHFANIAISEGSENSVALIMMELRDEDVVREFLTQWMALPGWEIWRVAHRTWPLDERFVTWIGFKTSE